MSSPSSVARNVVASAALVVALLVCASPTPAAAVQYDPQYAFTVNNVTIGFVTDNHELVLAASTEEYILPDLW